MKSKKSLIRNLIVFIFMTVLTLLMAWKMGIFQTRVEVRIYNILCDSFFVPGFIVLGVGILVLCTKGGVFDMLTYGIQVLAATFKKNPRERKYETFYDYVQAKEDRKNGSFLFLIVWGLIWIVIAVVFLILFQKQI